MSKKGLTIDLNSGHKILTSFIDDNLANGSDDISYSGKFVNDNLLSISHESHLVGDKLLDESNINNSFVVSYNQNDDKLEFSNVDVLVTNIDCGYF